MVYFCTLPLPHSRTMADNRFDNLTNIDGGRIVKMEVDYTAACDEKIPLYQEMAKDPKNLHHAIGSLLNLEKQTRLVNLRQFCVDVLGKKLQNPLTSPANHRVPTWRPVPAYLSPSFKYVSMPKIGSLSTSTLHCWSNDGHKSNRPSSRWCKNVLRMSNKRPTKIPN